MTVFCEVLGQPHLLHESAVGSKLLFPRYPRSNPLFPLVVDAQAVKIQIQLLLRLMSTSGRTQSGVVVPKSTECYWDVNPILCIAKRARRILRPNHAVCTPRVIIAGFPPQRLQSILWRSSVQRLRPRLTRSPSYISTQVNACLNHNSWDQL